MIAIDRNDHTLSFDPQHRPVRLFTFKCPVCGKECSLYGTQGPWFSIKLNDDSDFNIWHLDIDVVNMRVTINPSIGLHNNPKTGLPVDGHTTSCHLIFAGEPFEWYDY